MINAFFSVYVVSKAPMVNKARRMVKRAERRKRRAIRRANRKQFVHTAFKKNGFVATAARKVNKKVFKPVGRGLNKAVFKPIGRVTNAIASTAEGVGSTVVETSKGVSSVVGILGNPIVLVGGLTAAAVVFAM